MSLRILIALFLLGAIVAGGATGLALRATADRGTSGTVVSDPTDRLPSAPTDVERPAPSGRTTEDLLTLKAENRELEVQVKQLEARLTEIRPPPLDPDALRFGLPEKTPAFDRADWTSLSTHASELSTLLAELRRRITDGEDLDIGFRERLRKHNAPLAIFAVAFSGEMTDTTPNGAYTHPAVVANMIRAALIGAGQPLTHDQEIAIQTLGDAWIGESRRSESIVYSSRLADLVAEVDAKLRFLASVKNVLTDEQRAILFHPETEGRLKLDLLSPALVYVLTRDVPAQGREDMATKLLAALLDQAGLEVEDRRDYAWIGQRWVDEIPAAIDALSVRSVDLRFPHVDSVQARARAQAVAIERMLAMGGWSDEQVEKLHDVATLIYPFVIQRDE